MRALMIGLGLGGQMIANSTMEELQRMIYHAVIYELTALPLAIDGDPQHRLTDVSRTKVAIAEGIAFDLFFDPSKDPTLSSFGFNDKVRYAELEKKIKELERRGELTKEDKDDLIFFAKFVRWLKERKYLDAVVKELIEKNTFIVPFVINSSTMDFQSLDEEMGPVAIGATFDGHKVLVPRHEATKIPPNSRMIIGRHLTHGGGAGWDNVMGMRMAADSELEIASALRRIIQEYGSKGVYFNMYVIIYGSGGGTGSGSGPVVAKILKEIDPNNKILSFPILPTPEECRMRTYNSVTSLAFLAENSDGVGIVSLEDFRGLGESLSDAYKKIDSVLGKFFITMLGSEELPKIKREIKQKLLEIIRIAKKEFKTAKYIWR